MLINGSGIPTTGIIPTTIARLINIVDIISTVNIIIGGIEPTELELCAGDVNGDETINIVDVISIVNFILD